MYSINTEWGRIFQDKFYVHNTWWTIETIVMQVPYMIWHFYAFVTGLISATLFHNKQIVRHIEIFTHRATVKNVPQLMY